MNLKFCFSAGLATVLLTVGPVSQAVTQRADLLGDPARSLQSARTITVDPDTNQVNVVGGEVVGFVVNGKNFAWQFNGPWHSVDLNRILPPGVLTHKVTVYVSPNPLTPGY
jgi:hypothetical protein